MSEITLKQIVEGLLMAADRPLTVENLQKIIVDEHESFIATIPEVLAELVQDYVDRGIELKEVASGWRFHVNSDLSFWINKLYAERPPKYSRALLETLALIAYRQPITRAEIENVRGVTVSSNIVKTLLEHEWVRIVGYKEVPGRPALFATTKKFLDHFNLKSLSELPPLTEFVDTQALENESDKNIEMAVATCTPLEIEENAVEDERMIAEDDGKVSEDAGKMVGNDSEDLEDEQNVVDDDNNAG